MFAKMPIFDYPKDCKRYQVIANEAIKGLPDKITTRPNREGNQLSFRIFYGSEQTDFYVSAKGDLIYFDKAQGALARIDKDDILAHYANFIRSKDDC